MRTLPPSFAALDDAEIAWMADTRLTFDDQPTLTAGAGVAIVFGEECLDKLITNDL